jgi:hypothetical protein
MKTMLNKIFARWFAVSVSLILAISGIGAVTALLISPARAAVAELRVCPSGCAYSSVQVAVNDAHPGDIIKVAEGIYTDVHTATVGRVITQVVYLSKSVTIRGGYTAAFTEPPDSALHPTVLDAQGRGRVLYITGDVSPTIEGLRITGGDAVGLAGYAARWPEEYDAGGGVYVYATTAVLSNCLIYNNTAQWGGRDSFGL